MFAMQRQQKIMELLYANKGADVSVLSKLFNVSEVTIRRDFNKLESDGLIIKTYGGAILKEDEPDTDHLGIKTSDESGMVKLAVALIDDFDSVFIGTGACSLDIAKALSGRELSVVTNDVLVAAELSKTPTIRTFIIGSELKPFSSTLIGGYNEKMLKEELLFVSVVYS